MQDVRGRTNMMCVMPMHVGKLQYTVGTVASFRGLQWLRAGG